MERTLRLATGLTMFAYAGCHFASHATGLFRLDVMDAVGRKILLAPWETWLGRGALGTAVLVHASLGLRALYRRRHVRIPAAEAWQLLLGLSIPLLLLPHVTNVRVGAALYDLDQSYYRILYQYWVTPPLTGLMRQFLLLCAVWLHGCIGLHFWLRFRPWYVAWRPALLAGAVLLPFLAMLGVMNAGWDTQMTAALHPDFARLHGPPPPGSERAAQLAELHWLWDWMQLAWLALVALALCLREVRNLRARRVGGVRITYPDGRSVRVPFGFSVLEASRWGRIPHASICGGRGRCSTCRVHIARGLDGLPPPGPAEQETLRRVDAPPGVRLACQIRPRTDLSVVPVLPPDATARDVARVGTDARELWVSAMFVDLRNSTRLAAGRLPFDALFIIDRYVQRVTAAVQAQGGSVTSVAGDGVMSVFGAGRVTPIAAAASALRAASAVWDGLDALSAELCTEIDQPLAFGIGLHAGVSAVGSILVSGRSSLQFLGDTGNVAARLEAATKAMGCVLIVSESLLALARARPSHDARRGEVVIPGREALGAEQRCPVVLLREREDLRRLLDRAAPVADPPPAVAGEAAPA